MYSSLPWWVWVPYRFYARSNCQSYHHGLGALRILACAVGSQRLVPQDLLWASLSHSTSPRICVADGIPSNPCLGLPGQEALH